MKKLMRSRSSSMDAQWLTRNHLTEPTRASLWLNTKRRLFLEETTGKSSQVSILSTKKEIAGGHSHHQTFKNGTLKMVWVLQTAVVTTFLSDGWHALLWVSAAIARFLRLSRVDTTKNSLWSVRRDGLWPIFKAENTRMAKEIDFFVEAVRRSTVWNLRKRKAHVSGLTIRMNLMSQSLPGARLPKDCQDLPIRINQIICYRYICYNDLWLIYDKCLLKIRIWHGITFCSYELCHIWQVLSQVILVSFWVDVQDNSSSESIRTTATRRRIAGGNSKRWAFAETARRQRDTA